MIVASAKLPSQQAVKPHSKTTALNITHDTRPNESSPTRKRRKVVFDEPSTSPDRSSAFGNGSRLEDITSKALISKQAKVPSDTPLPSSSHEASSSPSIEKPKKSKPKSKSHMSEAFAAGRPSPSTPLASKPAKVSSDAPISSSVHDISPSPSFQPPRLSRKRSRSDVHDDSATKEPTPSGVSSIQVKGTVTGLSDSVHLHSFVPSRDQREEVMTVNQLQPSLNAVSSLPSEASKAKVSKASKKRKRSDSLPVEPSIPAIGESSQRDASRERKRKKAKRKSSGLLAALSDASGRSPSPSVVRPAPPRDSVLEKSPKGTTVSVSLGHILPSMATNAPSPRGTLQKKSKKKIEVDNTSSSQEASTLAIQGEYF